MSPPRRLRRRPPVGASLAWGGPAPAAQAPTSLSWNANAHRSGDRSPPVCRCRATARRGDTCRAAENERAGDEVDAREGSGFDSRHRHHWIAQRVEQPSHKRPVAGSTPAPSNWTTNPAIERSKDHRRTWAEGRSPQGVTPEAHQRRQPAPSKRSFASTASRSGETLIAEAHRGTRAQAFVARCRCCNGTPFQQEGELP